MQLQPHTWDTSRPSAAGMGPYFKAQTARISELLLGWNSFPKNVDVKELQRSKQNKKDPANFACFPCSEWHKPNASTQLWASSSAAFCVEVRLGSVPERWSELLLKVRTAFTLLLLTIIYVRNNVVLCTQTMQLVTTTPRPPTNVINQVFRLEMSFKPQLLAYTQVTMFTYQF